MALTAQLMSLRSELIDEFQTLEALEQSVVDCEHESTYALIDDQKFHVHGMVTMMRRLLTRQGRSHWGDAVDALLWEPRAVRDRFAQEYRQIMDRITSDEWRVLLNDLCSASQTRPAAPAPAPSAEQRWRFSRSAPAPAPPTEHARGAGSSGDWACTACGANVRSGPTESTCERCGLWASVEFVRRPWANVPISPEVERQALLAWEAFQGRPGTIQEVRRSALGVEGWFTQYLKSLNPESLVF